MVNLAGEEDKPLLLQLSRSAGEEDEPLLLQLLRFTPLAQKETFNEVEKFLLKIPTWKFTIVPIVFLIALSVWVEENLDFKSPQKVAKVIFQNVDAIAIVAGVALYFKEIPDRKTRKHYEAWQVIDSAASTQASYARKQALEDLCSDGVSLSDINVSGTQLSRINLSGAELIEANLIGTNLEGANLIGANLEGANLQGANLMGANLFGATLESCKLDGANLFGTDFTGAAFWIDTSTPIKDNPFVPRQIKSAENWETAKYDPEIRVLLGLDP